MSNDDDDNDKDLNFWMDSVSTADESEISDDDAEINSAISPKTKNSKSKKNANSPSPKSKSRRKRASSHKDSDDDDDDDVIIAEQPIINNVFPMPPELQEPITPFETEYHAPELKSKESQALEVAVNNIRNDITKMLNTDDDDDDILPYQVSAPISKKEGDLTLIFVYPKEDFQEERILQAGQSFLTVFQTLPERFEDCLVQIDGVTYPPKDVLHELLFDYTKVTLIEPEESASTKGCKKLAFVLPSGEKLKHAVDPNDTFRQILIKLNVPNGKLMFDGEPLPLDMKVSQNDELEDGDQIDVCLQ